MWNTSKKNIGVTDRMRKQGFKEEADNNLLSPLEDLLIKSL